MELRKCIQAIVSASPELLSQLAAGDFTIYAYDYSEYDTPLVGQGMLSSILAAVSPTPAAPAHQSKTMITGRVCQNVMGLFSNGVKETLEVKLRLVPVPVPKPLQNEYLKTMEVYRTISPATSAGFDPNAWSASLHTAALSLGTPFEEAPTPTSVRNDSAEHPFDNHSNHSTHSNPSYQRPRLPSSASFHAQPSFVYHTPAFSAPVSRTNSPTLPQHQPMQYPARPSSRASLRSDHSHRRRESCNARDQYQEEGPARKRVKVTQTEWRGKSAFGANPADLRVTASTAASIRIHRPVPTRPNMVNRNSLEPPPRAPTPVPQSFSTASRHGSFLRRESSLAKTQSYRSPYSQPIDMPTRSDAGMSSPEDNARNRSPTDFPSSPPMMPEPSSPGLPSMPSFPKPMVDSGYMSSPFEGQDDDEDRSVDEEDLQMAQQYESREPKSQLPFSDFIEQTPGPPELLPNRMQMDRHSSRNPHDPAADLSRQKARNAVLPPAERRGSLSLPPKPKDKSQERPRLDDIKPNMTRYSSNAMMRSEAASPAPTDDGAVLPKAPRSGSGAKRKKTIQDKLLQAVSQGEKPAYCGNCGAIETPTWRALFTRVMTGSPSELGPVIDGVTMGTEILERDDEGKKITKYRIIKSTRKGKDPQEVAGYETLQVCNPCGLWFNKYKIMRPQDKWQKKTSKRSKRKTENDPAGPSEPQSDFFADQPSALYADPPIQPKDQSVFERCQPAAQIHAAAIVPSRHPRANSEQPEKSRSDGLGQWSNAALDAALHRAIQSSPAARNFVGTEQSPIDLSADELTPQPTRRLLFPSPRRAGQVKSLDDIALPGSKPQSTTIIEAAFVQEPMLDKENMPPSLPEDDDLSHLFECSPGIFKTPARKITPTKRTPRIGSGSFDDLLKTPTPNRSSLKTLSSNARQAFTPRTIANNSSAFLPTFTSAEKQNMGLGLPTTPSRYANLSSPSRASKGELTPFTRHLTQLLSETNGGNGNTIFSSPGRVTAFDFSELPTFMTPGGTNMGMGIDFDKMEFDVADFATVGDVVAPENNQPQEEQLLLQKNVDAATSKDCEKTAVAPAGEQ